MNRWLLFLSLLLASFPLSAQEASTRPASPPRHYYRLNYVLKETDDGKLINQRSFVLTVRTGERGGARLRAGSRFPVRDEKTNYVDVGVNIDGQLEESPDGLELEGQTEISSVGTENATTGAAPVIRQVRANAQATVVPNKPTVLFTIDDPASHHRFELEVTVTPQH